MKNKIYLLLICVLSGITQSFAQSPTANETTAKVQKGAQLKFDNPIFNFGIIPYKGPGEHLFVITNTGTEPLVIYNCIKGCGLYQCRVDQDTDKPRRERIYKSNL